ncbi:MAG: pseudaminic acid cytidylyltransferase, partial [Gammaproteobacteria bacterium]|nr:pseudaminic acid cytidylyltransferase [Gammaproteobacteria bacterium]
MRLRSFPRGGGSKRIPRKNLAPVLGKPMIGWVIEIACSTR